MDCGTIFYDRKFQFEDTGKIIDKLGIVICEAGDCHFVFYTTSQPIGTAKSGCNLADKPPNFFIPAYTAFFQKDTWVLLHQVNEYPEYLLEEKINSKVIDLYVNQFPRNTM